MSVLTVSKDERAALEAQFVKMQKAGTLPGGVMLGTPVELEDNTYAYVDTRWDAPGEKEAQIRERVTAMKADPKAAVSKAVVSAALPAKVKAEVESIKVRK
jgi:hypothetical protein